MDPINPWLDSEEVRRLAETLMRPQNDPVAAVRNAGFNPEFVGFEAEAEMPLAELDTPTEPEIPTEPKTPTETEIPIESAVSAEPAIPADPIAAAAPSEPVAPAAPVEAAPGSPPVSELAAEPVFTSAADPSAAPPAQDGLSPALVDPELLGSPALSQTADAPEAPREVPDGPAPEIAPLPLAAPASDPLSPPPLPPRASPPAANSPERSHFLERVKRFRDWMRDQFSATGVFVLDREGSVIFDESGHGRLHFMARSLALAPRRPGSPAGNVHVKVGAGATFEVIPVDTAYGCLVLGAVVPHTLSPSSVAAVMEALASTAGSPGNSAC